MFPVLKTINEVRLMMNKLSQLFHAHTVSGGVDIQSRLADMKVEIIKRDDAAVIDYTRQFDRVTDPDFQMRVTPEEIEEAKMQVPAEFVSAIQAAKVNIEAYHRNQLPQDWDNVDASGNRFGVQFRALDSVGMYVPGGRASYPSTVLMNAIPAQLAGVKQLIMATPPNHEGKISPGVLAAADCCGIDQIYKVGGAQAVFALAQGTQTIPKVDKIVGPGNIYVTKAKQMVYGLVDIDKPAGPSEVMVYVKDGKHAPYAASELLAQLEHDPLASGVILSTDAEVLKLVKKSLIKQMPKLNRQDVLTRSAVNGMLFLAEDEAHAIECINYVASEHLVLLFDDYEPVLKQINHAGSIFCGVYTPVTLGDYYAGPNHVLPTERAARFSSPLGVMDFVKYSSYMEYTKDSLQKAAPDIKALTDMEGFDAHYAAVDVRLS